MPRATATGGLAAKLGNKANSVLSAHQNDEVNYGQGGEVPAGIEGGIARLIDIRFGTYKDGPNKGEPFFIAAGTVVSPRDHEGIPVEGLRTQVGPEPLCDTPNSQGKKKTLDDHLLWVQNEIRKLLPKGSSGELVSTVDAMESTCAALKEQKPHFRFRTWKGQKSAQFPNPRTNHTWGGVCEYNGGDGPGDVQDNSASTVESPQGDDLDQMAIDAENDAAVGEKMIEMAVKAGIPRATAQATSTWSELADMLRNGGSAGDSGDGEATAAGGDDYSGMIEKAKEGDDDAMAELKKIAKKEFGISAAEFDAMDWDEVAEKMSGSAQAAPSVGEIVFYKPIDPKTKKPAKKALEYKVVAVDEDEKTCTLENLDNPKISYKKVKWADLLDGNG